MLIMKILVIAMSLGASGGVRVITKLANAWIGMGNDVDMLVVYDSKTYFPISQDVNILNVECKSNYEARKKAAKYIRENEKKYDAFISTHWVSAYILKKALKSYGKCFYYIQAYEPDFYEGHSIKQIMKRYFAQKSYKLPLRKIVNSYIYTKYKTIQTNSVVFPGLDLKLYYPKNTSFFHKKIRIGTIGRFEAWKGSADVCKAMEILKSEGVDFDFYIAFNDFDTIPHHFVKPDGDENLSAFYRDMDIVIAACKGQFGAIHYPVIETMAVGSTIVCTDYYPSNENNSYKIEVSSPKQIAETIKHIINNKEEAIKKREQALKDVEEFDWSFVAQKFYNYLQEGLKTL